MEKWTNCYWQEYQLVSTGETLHADTACLAHDRVFPVSANGMHGYMINITNT